MNYLTKGVLLGTLVLTSFSTVSCTEESQSKNVSENDSTAAIPVETATSKSENVYAYYSSTTTLEAEEQAMVVAKVQGIVEKLNAEEGDWVKAGDMLAQLEDEQLSLEAERAKATMDRLNNELTRKKELYDKNLISAQEFENAKYEYEAQNSAYDLAKLQLKYSSIQAPISGVISKRLIKTGNMIKANQEVYEITDFDPILAVLQIPEHEMSKLEKGQTARIAVDAIPNQTFEGSVLRVSPTVNPETGTFEVTVALKDESRKLKPGMFGRIRIIYDAHENAITVPKNAVMSEDGINSVYQIRNNIAFRTTVKTGYANGDRIEIIDGLNPADTVVTVGQNSLQDSALVDIVSL